MVSESNGAKLRVVGWASLSLNPTYAYINHFLLGRYAIIRMNGITPRVIGHIWPVILIKPG